MRNERKGQERGKGEKEGDTGKRESKARGNKSEWYIERKWVDKAALRASAISWAYVEERGGGSPPGVWLSGLARSSE